MAVSTDLPSQNASACELFVQSPRQSLLSNLVTRSLQLTDWELMQERYLGSNEIPGCLQSWRAGVSKHPIFNGKQAQKIESQK